MGHCKEYNYPNMKFVYTSSFLLMDSIFRSHISAFKNLYFFTAFTKCFNYLITDGVSPQMEPGIEKTLKYLLNKLALPMPSSGLHK